MRTRDMALMTWQEVAEAADVNCGVIIPIGSTEQHGYHLPLSTDTFFPKQLALEIAEDTHMIVAPPLAYGYRSRPLSGGGQTFPGTTSISGKTLMALTEDILEEFIRQNFKRIVLLSWHWENQNFIYESAYLVTQRHPDVKIVVMESPFDTLSEDTMDFMFPDEFPGWAREHASIMETSLMLHIRPDLVLFDRAVDDCSEEYPFYDVVPIPDTFYPKSGTLWKATQSNAEKGKRAWGEIVDAARALIQKELPI